MWLRLFVFNIYLDNANKLCHPLFVTQFFMRGEPLQSKIQHIAQGITRCNLLVVSNVCNNVIIK